jgi:Pvc16 N-terminal domain
MSNSRAIAAVTATLQRLLMNVQTDDDLGDTQVTALALDIARDDVETNQLNLFLYQTSLNGAWRNMDMPGRVKPGEMGHPPLALDLFYLITAYGRGNKDIDGHRALGRAMRILHDHPVLGREEIESALQDNDLHQQLERIRITPQPLTLDELSKLWTGCQGKYRISVAYQVSVVLIESLRQVKAALPVLTRGEGDAGVLAQQDLVPPFPTIVDVRPPDDQPSARLGDLVSVEGFHLHGDAVKAVFVSPRLPTPIELLPEGGASSTELHVLLPDDNAARNSWVAGLYSVSVEIDSANEPSRTTNVVPLALAPLVTVPPGPVARDLQGDATVTIEVRPDIRPDQEAVLMVGDRQVTAEPHFAQTDSVSFMVRGAEPGEFFVRLRVDGVDSLLVDRSVTPPSFDPAQKVTIGA